MFRSSRAANATKLLLLGCLAARLLVTPAPAVSDTSVTLAPVADASAYADQPFTNFGSAATLDALRSPVRRSYLRFAIPDGAPVVRATLSLRALQSGTFDLHPVANNSWSESGIIFLTSPGFGSVYSASVPATAGARVSIDVTALVAGKSLVSLGIATSGPTSMSFGSRESGTSTPQLLIETAAQTTTSATTTSTSTTSTSTTTTSTSTTTTSTSTTTTSTTTTTTTAPPPPPTGTSYYVDADAGNDTRAGTSPATAWKSLSKASQAPLQPGDQLLFERGGSWSGTLTLGANGTASKPITVSAYGTGARPSFVGDCLEVPGSYLVVTGLEVHDCSWEGIGINGHHNRIEDNVVRNNVTGVFVRQVGADNKVLRNQVKDNNRMSVNTPECCNDSGAFAILLHGDRTEVAYNTISGSDAFSYDYGRDGAAIEVYGGRNNTVHHNLSIDNDTFAELGNSRSADNTFAYNLARSSLTQSIFLVTRGAQDGYGPIARTTLVNNTALLTGSSSQGAICYGGCSPDILVMRNNIVQAVAKAGYADAPFTDDHNLYWGGPRQFALGSTSIVADPRFVSPGSWDLHLRADSPAVDRGVATGWGQDLDGRSVPRDGNGDGTAAVDLGCYER